MSESNTVEVGCRIPNGLRATVTGWIDDPQDKGKKIAREIGMLELAGSGGHVGNASLHHDVAYTPVDAKLFDAWLEDNAESDLVTSGAIFKKDDGGDAEKDALEREDLARHEREGREKLEREMEERRAKRAANADPDPVAGQAAQLNPRPGDGKGFDPQDPPHTTETHPLEVEPAAPKPVRFDPETGKPIAS